MASATHGTKIHPFTGKIEKVHSPHLLSSVSKSAHFQEVTVFLALEDDIHTCKLSYIKNNLQRYTKMRFQMWEVA